MIKLGVSCPGRVCWLDGSSFADGVPIYPTFARLAQPIAQQAQILNSVSLKFIYSEKATEFCEISTTDLTVKGQLIL